MKNICIILTIFCTTLISAEVKTNLELFSLGFSGSYKQKNGTIELEVPTLYIDEVNTNLSLMLTPGKLSYTIDSNDEILYTPFLFGARWNLIGNDMFFLGPYINTGIDLEGSFSPEAGIVIHGSYPIFEKTRVVDNILFKLISFSVGYNFVDESIIFKVSADPLIAAIMLVPIWGDHAYSEADKYGPGNPEDSHDPKRDDIPDNILEGFEDGY